MQMNSNNSFGISLTATLAELYEAQKHYYAAYIVYWYLYLTQQKEEFSEKLNDIKKTIFASNDTSYDSLIGDIFSDEEIQELGILPKTMYKDYETAAADLQRDDKESALNIDSGEKENFRELGKGIGLEWQQIMKQEGGRKDEGHKEKEKAEFKRDRLKECKVADFVNFLHKIKAEDQNLEDKKLSALFDSFLHEYGSSPTTKQKEGTTTTKKDKDNPHR